MTNGIVSRTEHNNMRVVRAGLSTVGLLSIVVIAPLALFMAGGWPLSHVGVGYFGGVISSRRSYDVQSVIDWLIRCSLLVAWISWAWMTVCVVLEVRSRVTGRSSARLPASRTVQSLAAFLVGTALTISSIGRVASGPRTERGPTTGQTETPSIVVRVIEDPLPTRLGPPSHRKPAPSGTTATTAYQGDSGSARPAGPPHGRPGPVGLAVLDDRERPVIETPEDDVPKAVRSVATAQSELADRLSSGPQHLVVERETLWSIANDRLGSALRWKELARLNYGIPQPDGGTLTEEHWIHTGWSLVLPPPVSGSKPPSGIGAPSAPIGHPAPGIDATGTDCAGAPVPLVPRLPLVPVGAGVVGAGVVRLLDRMRQVQQRHRRGGRYIRLPELPLSVMEKRLRIGDGRETARAVDAAVRLFVRECSDSDLPAPPVNGITVRPDAIELVVDPADALDALRDLPIVRPDGRSVVIDRSALTLPSEPHDRFTANVSPAPLLVTAGHGSDGLVLVNLESLGSLVVSGDHTACEGFVRALALELATSFWSGRFDLVLVGFGAEFERFERITSVAEAGPILDVLCRRRFDAVHLLGSSGQPSFAHARAVDGSDRWDPLAVICGPAVAEADVAELILLSSDPRLGLSVVTAAGGSEASQVLTLTGPHQASSLELLASVVFPQQVGADDLAQISSLVVAAASRESTLLSEEPYVNLSIAMPTKEPGTSPNPETTPARRSDQEVEVAVLGPIEVRGAAREFTRAWAKELVVYLAMHPNGATNEAWATALWPDRLMAPSSLHSTASVARRSLGSARSGLDHLPHSHGRLGLAGTVGTDWDHFVALAESDDVDCWRSALELIRGRPFEGIRASDWPILEGIGPAIESAVVDLSGRLAGARLSMGDPRGAEWAARKGLLVSPYDERLYRMLMRAAELGGNPAGVEAVMSELVKLVAEDIEPFDSVHPRTMDLYRSLTRRRAVPIRPR